MKTSRVVAANQRKYPQLLISKELREIGVNIGDLVEVEVKGNEVIIRKASRDEYESLDEVIKEIIDKRCVNCGERLKLGFVEIGFYEHDGGWFIKSLNKKLWIYAKCLHCGYENSLHKILRRS